MSKTFAERDSSWRSLIQSMRDWKPPKFTVEFSRVAVRLFFIPTSLVADLPWSPISSGRLIAHAIFFETRGNESKMLSR